MMAIASRQMRLLPVGCGCTLPPILLAPGSVLTMRMYANESDGAKLPFNRLAYCQNQPAIAYRISQYAPFRT